MIDLSQIRNYKLRTLMQASAKFNALPKEEQKKHVERIRNLPAAKQEELCDFFRNENKKEQDRQPSNEEQLEILKQLYEDVVALEKKFTKLLKKEPEMREREQENHKMDNLLEKLNNT